MQILCFSSFERNIQNLTLKCRAQWKWKIVHCSDFLFKSTPIYGKRNDKNCSRKAKKEIMITNIHATGITEIYSEWPCKRCSVAKQWC